MAISTSGVNFAKNVWKGMTEGVERGKNFRVSGTYKANKALGQVEKNAKKGMEYVHVKNLKNVGTAEKNITKKAIKNKKTGKMNNIKMTSYSNNKKKIKLSNNIQKRPTFGEKTGDFLGGGIRDTYKNMTTKDMSFGKALKDAHRNPDGKINMKRVAGTYVAASSVGRIASGGGIMKDKNGNTNVIGIPFI